MFSEDTMLIKANKILNKLDKVEQELFVELDAGNEIIKDLEYSRGMIEELKIDIVEYTNFVNSPRN